MAPAPWAGACSASKAAVHVLTDTLRHFGIHVMNVASGAIRSNIGNLQLPAAIRCRSGSCTSHLRKL
ncbi:hypothetical protein WN944_023593 [Citrus x changshan-huyou]|uniref:Uncharacterized protein n=1 Tax=Citrus x changshan-huyou TaxID=2935761 RepID=A0AAP0N322_9ROSI